EFPEAYFNRKAPSTLRFPSGSPQATTSWAAKPSHRSFRRALRAGFARGGRCFLGSNRGRTTFSRIGHPSASLFTIFVPSWLRGNWRTSHVSVFQNFTHDACH